jgi:RNA polymerase primary sigma factor
MQLRPKKGSLMRYEHRGDRAPRPCEAETRSLVLAAQDDDERAAGSLIVAFTPSIRAVARGYCRWPSLDEGELVQEGIVGLLRAVGRFDSGVNAPFWAYAVFWVRQAMQRLVAELTGAVVLSDRALRQMARVKAARREYQRTHSSEPTSRDLAALTGFDVAHVDGLTVAERRPRALGEPVREASGSSMTFADLVVDPRAEDAYEEVSSSIDSGPIEDLLDCLSERERTVIRARFGLGGPQRTLREVGAQLRISAERVRQIQECALGKLRNGADSTPHVPVGG